MIILFYTDNHRLLVVRSFNRWRQIIYLRSSVKISTQQAICDRLR